MVDTGSLVDLIFRETLKKMEIKDSEIKPANIPLTRFTSKTTVMIRTIKLPVYVRGVTKLVHFVVIDKPAIYDVIIGTPWIYSIRAIPSTYHQCVKFSTPDGVFTIRGNQRIS